MEEYLDFRVHIAQGTGQEFSVSLTSPVGPSSGTLRLPFDPASLENALLRVERAVGESREMLNSNRDVDDVDVLSVSSFGEQIFQALFTKDVEVSFRKSQNLARQEGKGLRIRLSIEPASLACLPWEFLYDSSVGDFVCLSSYTPVVRFLEFENELALLKVTPPLRMLAMIASPSDLPQLDVAKEKARIMEATRFLRDNGLLRIDWLDANATYDALQKALRRKDVDYHIFHFVGHGGFSRSEDEGVLAFEDVDRTRHEISSLDIGRLLADERCLRLVVLNSCLGAKGSATNALSSTAAALVRRGVPSVVAMQYKISDGAAIEFSRALYEAIAEGLPIDAAVGEARKSLSVAVRRSVEWATPVLYTRTPDGVLFSLAGPTPSSVRRKTGEFFPSQIPPQVPHPGTAPLEPQRTAAGSAGPPPAEAAEAAPAPAVVPPPPQSVRPQPAPSRTGMFAAVAAIVVIGAGAAAYSMSRDATPAAPVPLVDTAIARAARPDTTAVAAPVRPRPGLPIPMVTIPGGSFTMGAVDVRWAQPARAVEVPAFAIGEREVTVGEFQAFVDANPSWQSVTNGCLSDQRTQRLHPDWSWRQPDFPQDSTHPVVCVSVRDALAFIGWLNRVDSTAQYRLPSEAEWEYAARGGTTTPRYWTDPNETCEYAVSAERPPLCGLMGASKGTQPGSGRKPNAFGVRDMLGNASEWTQDCWNDSYAGAPATGAARRTGLCSHQVVRGGAWPHSLREVNAAFRSYWDVNQASNLIGFQVARSVPTAAP